MRWARCRVGVWTTRSETIGLRIQWPSTGKSWAHTHSRPAFHRSEQRPRHFPHKRHLLYQGNASLSGKDDARTIRNVRAEFRYLKDPKALAQAVARHAQKGDITHALSLVRVASAQIDTVVAWNHVLEFIARVDNADTVFKIFNEMKKRGVQPSAITYTVILRGLAYADPDAKDVELAQKLLKLLDAEGSSTAKGIIHVNAALDVFVNAGDMDVFWSAVSQLPDSGPGSPDHITYSVIFKALKRDLERNAMSDDAEERGRVVTILEDARTVWAEVINKWKKGTLDLEEQVLCSYLRLLLKVPSRESAMEALQIVEACGGPKAILDASNDSQASKAQDGGYTSVHDMPDDAVIAPASPIRKETTDSAETRSRRGPRRIWFSTNTLSLCLEALLVICPAMPSTLRTPAAYWKHFSQALRVLPDMDNYMSMLRICIAMNDSTMAAGLIAELELRRDDGASVSRQHGGVRSATTRPMGLSSSALLLAMIACAKSASRSRSSQKCHVISGQDLHRLAGADLVDSTARKDESIAKKLSPWHSAEFILQVMTRSAVLAPVAMSKYLACAMHSHSPTFVLDALRSVDVLLKRYAETVGNSRKDKNRTYKANEARDSTGNANDILSTFTFAIKIAECLRNEMSSPLSDDSLVENGSAVLEKLRNVLKSLKSHEQALRRSTGTHRLVELGTSDVVSLKTFRESLVNRFGNKAMQGTAIRREFERPLIRLVK